MDSDEGSDFILRRLPGWEAFEVRMSYNAHFGSLRACPEEF